MPFALLVAVLQEDAVGPNYARIDLGKHTHLTPPTSTGSQCISCHMPKTGENSVGADARDLHLQLRFLPAASNWKEKDPNSCNLLSRQSKTPEWALLKVKEWYPKLK